MASRKKPSDGTSAREPLKAEMTFLGNILEHHEELELSEQQFTALSQMYWTRSSASTITEIVEAAASTLSSNQLHKAIALMAPRVAPPGRPGAEDTTMERIATEALEKLSKEKQLIEVEVASKVAERLMGWAKVFAFFLAAPAALCLIILGVVGVSKFEDVQGKIRDALTKVDTALEDVQSKIRDAQTKVDTALEQVNPLLTNVKKTQAELASVQSDLAQQRQKFAELSDTVAKLSEKRRYALVIGNSDYRVVGERVQGLIDYGASKIASVLRTLGFDVHFLSDADAKKMSSAVKKLQTDVSSGAEIALLYFAGYSTEKNGETLLIPVDAGKDDFEAKAIELSSIAKALSNARRVGLILIDACRKSAAFSGGCAFPPSIPPRVVLGYSTRPGITIDFESKYASALEKYLAKPGRELIEMLEDVELEVYRASGEKQFAWKTEGPQLAGPIYLAPAQPPAQER
jgi:archaellum component FlaC